MMAFFFALSFLSLAPALDFVKEGAQEIRRRAESDREAAHSAEKICDSLEKIHETNEELWELKIECALAPPTARAVFLAKGSSIAALQEGLLSQVEAFLKTIPFQGSLKKAYRRPLPRDICALPNPLQWPGGQVLSAENSLAGFQIEMREHSFPAWTYHKEEIRAL